MLVLTRKIQQQIQFGNDIVITILQVRGQSVRVGIEAPRGVRVVRGEIASKPASVKAAALPAARVEVQGPQAVDDSTSSRAEAHVECGAVLPAAGCAMFPVASCAVASGVTAAAGTFSSPTAPRPRIVGESSGLFPFLRRRDSSSLTLDATLRPTEHPAPQALRSLAGNRA